MSADAFVISQPAGTRTLALRESYMAICEGDACEAHLLNALERWYVYKLKVRDESRGRNKAAAQSGEAADADEALWVRMSAGQWATTELLGIYNEKTVRTKLARLVERGYVLTRENPRLKWDRTPQWLLNRPAVQTAVNDWAQTRVPVDLDPGEADELENTDSQHSDLATESTRTNVRMQSEEVPDQVGQISALTRTNVRSNNTGILTQESSTDIQKQSSSSKVTSAQARSGSDDDDQTAVAEDQEGLQTQSTLEGSETLLLSGNDGDQVDGTKLKQATSTEQVPPAAAGLAALQSIPRAVLEARPARDPEQMTTLRGLMSASNKKRLEYLHSELAGATRSGIPMALATRLTDEELERARAAALVATTPALSFASAARRAVERLIGEPHAPPSPRGSEAQVLNAGQARRNEPEPDRPAETIEVGTRWEHKTNKEKIVTIVDITGGKIELHTGETLLSYILTKDYKRVN